MNEVMNAPIPLKEFISILKLIKTARRIRKNLGPEFTKPANRKHRPADAVASWGCCYVACEALYHLGAKAAGFVPAYIWLDHDVSSIFASHWILIRKDGRVLDPTVDQFPQVPDYAFANRCGFLTKRPSYRARKLIKLAKGTK